MSELDALVVGPIFDFEDYGIFINENNFYKETLRRAVNTLNLNHDTIDAFKNRWFASSGGDTGDAKTDIPIALYIVPSILGISFFIILVGVLSTVTVMTARSIWRSSSRPMTRTILMITEELFLTSVRPITLLAATITGWISCIQCCR